jgi:flagellar protein FlaF
MKSAAHAYGNVAVQSSNPRELEASLLLEAAKRLQAAKEGRADTGSALDHNRKLWTLLISAVTSDANPLDRAIRQNVANLGLFVCKQTVSAMLDPKADKVAPLIQINREVAAGLLGR